GDGMLASFDSPAGAVRCALALVVGAKGLGLSIRAGVHTGELELIDGKVRGIALHIASRIADRAAPGEVLTSGTTRELAEGAGLEFLERGEQTFKGIAASKRVFAATETAAGTRPDLREPTLPEGLTPRELDVLRLVAVG